MLDARRPLNGHDRRSSIIVARRSSVVHCKKYPYIHTDILRRVFRTLTEPVPRTFASVNRRNNEVGRARAGTIFRRFTDTNELTEPVPLNMENSPAQSIRGYTGIFTVYPVSC